MTDCDRCGTPTVREAFGSQIPEDTSEIVAENNGVIWLCDQCIVEFGEWLGDD